MEQYPTILGSKKAPIGKSCIAFYKYDGSNLRWEWSPKQSWHKFGTRTQLFDGTNSIFSKAIPIFMDIMSEEIVNRIKFTEHNPQRITVFTEFFGLHSFAGTHDLSDTMELRLLDVYLYKKGMMKAKDFVKVFGDLPYAPELVYQGNLTKSFIDDVRTGKFPDIWEGVVCKGDDFMVKIKTNAYFQKLNEVFGKNYKLYWE